jgi:Ca2+-binding EF-hand superfamily protein
MNKLTLGGVATAAMVIAAAAIAQPPAAPVAPAPPSAPQQRVEIMRIERGPMRAHTREDVVKHVRELFGRLDTNRDGFISREEADIVKLAMGDDMREHFADRLAERDGRRPDRGAAFDRLDTNKDGMVSREEFMSAKPRTEERRMIVIREGVGGEAGGPAKMRMHRMGMGLHGRLFDMADANHDGKVSLQEATDAALRHFDMADANHDGKITPDEHMQMRQKIRIERHPA